MLRKRPADIENVGPVLPSTSELLSALRGQQVHGHVREWSCDLVQLHRMRREHPQSAAVIDCLRSELVAKINGWTMEQLSGPISEGRLDANLGDVIDRIAATADQAFHLLMTDDPAGERMHTTWTLLAELSIAYGDLVHEASNGRWCLYPHAKRR